MCVKYLRLLPLLSGMILVSAAVQAQTPNPGAYHFTKIGIKHYDPRVIADLMTRPSGIIVVPPNFVIPAGGNATNLNMPTVATVPSVAAGFAPPPPGWSAAPVSPASAAASAANVLPEGVRRIFVHEGDNSLIVEATPDGLAQLSL